MTTSSLAAGLVRQPLRCLVVDNDPAACRALHRHLARLPSLQVLGSCTNAPDALALLHAQPVDILFLDVRLPLLSGLDLLHLLLRSLARPPFTVLVTDSPAYGVQAFDYAVTDYLLKPVTFTRLQQAIQRIERLAIDTPATTALLDSAEFIFVKTGNKFTRVGFAEVHYLQAHGSYVHIVTSHQRLTVFSSLRALKNRFPSGEFRLVHRSYLVNIRCIKSVEERTLTVKEIQLPIGSKFRVSLLQALNVL